MAKFQKIMTPSVTALIPGELGLPYVTLACGHIQFYSMEQLEKKAKGTDKRRLCRECK